MPDHYSVRTVSAIDSNILSVPLGPKRTQQCVTMLLKSLLAQRLRQQVGHLVPSGNLAHFNTSSLVVLADEMTVKFDVLVAARDDWIFHHFYAGLVVLIDLCRSHLSSADFGQQITEPQYFF